MPAPTDFRQRKFPINAVILNSGDFSIAWGIWEGNYPSLGMRWNGEGADPGYPKLFGNPVWFLIPKELVVPVLKGLQSECAEHVDQEALARVLKEIEG